MIKTKRIASLTDQFEIAASNGRFLEEFCVERNIDLRTISRPLGIDVDCFQDFDTRISLDKFCRLLESLAIFSSDDVFGLRYGMAYKLGGTGPFGYGLSNAPSFKEALRFCARYFRISVDLDRLDLFIEKDSATINWSFSPLLAQREQFADFSAAAILRHLHKVSGSEFIPLRAQLERRKPADQSLHMSLLSKRIMFGTSLNSVTIPGNLLQQKNPDSDHVMYEYMCGQCEGLLETVSRKKDTLTLLQEQFLEGMETNDRAIADVAKRLGMSDRTLQRRLTECGTTYWEVFEQTKDELSNRLLDDTSVPLSEIARRLGYSSQSAYTRAIKRWHGKTPAQIRSDLQNKNTSK